MHSLGLRFIQSILLTMSNSQPKAAKELRLKPVVALRCKLMGCLGESYLGIHLPFDDSGFCVVALGRFILFSILSQSF